MISPQISIGPLTLHVYGLILGLAILAGWHVAKRRASFYKVPQEIFEGLLILIPITSALFFARLYHVLDQKEFYFKNPTSVLFIQNGGLGIWGAILGGILGVWLVAKIKRIPLLKLLDLFSPAFALGQAIGRFGNWVNQEGFGPPTDLPLGVYISEANRPIAFKINTHFHPTFLYESALDLIIFFLLLKLSKRFKAPGQVFALYLILYSVTRFFLEFLRIDTWVAGGFKVAQVISIVALLVGAALFFKSRIVKHK